MSIKSGDLYFNQYVKNILIAECNAHLPKEEKEQINMLIKKYFEKSLSVSTAGEKLGRKVKHYHSQGLLSINAVAYVRTLLDRYLTINAVRLQEMSRAILNTVPVDYAHKEIMHENLQKESENPVKDNTPKPKSEESYSKLCCHSWYEFYKDPLRHKLLMRYGIVTSVKDFYCGKEIHTFSDEFNNKIPTILNNFLYTPNLDLLDCTITVQLPKELQLELIKKLRNHSPEEIVHYKLVCKNWNDQFDEDSFEKANFLAISLFNCLNNVYPSRNFSISLSTVVLGLEQYSITKSLDTYVTKEQAHKFESNFSDYEKNKFSNGWYNNEKELNLQVIFKTLLYNLRGLTYYKSLRETLLQDMWFIEDSLPEKWCTTGEYMNSRDQFHRFVTVLENIYTYLGDIFKMSTAMPGRFN